MAQQLELLVYNIKTMQVLFVWPFSEQDVATGRFKRNSTCVILIPTFALAICMCVDFYRQVGLGMRDSVANVTENILGMCCLTTLTYCTICYQIQMQSLLRLHKRLMAFDEIGVPADQADAEDKARFVSKGYIVYGSVACIGYFFMPFLFLAQCEERRAKSTYSQHIPCGMFSRLWLPFRFDHSPLFEVAEVFLIYPLAVFSFVTITSFTLLFSFVTHFISHIDNFKRKLYLAVQGNSQPAVRECVRYHMEIMRFCSTLNDIFSKFAFIHITITSIALSVLAYELVQFVSAYESFRLGLHFMGWMSVLFLACFAGQQLIDASDGIHHAAYDTNWPDANVFVQKAILLIILRAQKPLTVNTGAFGTLSLEMFLAITTTAYTYFTLLASH